MAAETRGTGDEREVVDVRLVRGDELADPAQVQGVRGRPAELTLFPGTVRLEVSANVAGRVLTATELVDVRLYDRDSVFREEIRRHLREKLAMEIVKHWKPVIVETR